MVLHSHFEEANERAKNLQESLPKAISARYDDERGELVINLSSKLAVSFFPRDVQGLEKATASQLKEIEITPSGFGIHFPQLDADLYVPGLLEGFLGSKRWMAATLGRAGGKSRSRAKKAAAKANGRLGGRPAKASGRR